jgi:hypothetical protein
MLHTTRHVFSRYGAMHAKKIRVSRIELGEVRKYNDLFCVGFASSHSLVELRRAMQDVGLGWFVFVSIGSGLCNSEAV